MDPGKGENFSKDEIWGGAANRIFLFEKAEESDGEGSPFRSTPFSGNERNRLFMRRGDNYDDMTLVSGVDFREDGRGFVLLDADRDGLMDLGVVSPNEPRFRIIKNKFSQHVNQKNGFVEVKLVGGQSSTEPSIEWSARDAFGATVLVSIGQTKRKFQLSCGEGLSSQNSKCIHVGLGEVEKIDRLEVTWPSGKTTVRENVTAGERITILEKEEK
ncbi:MAG: ASPIC/UnbV domain-containing protein [Mariniblastus sp.]